MGSEWGHQMTFGTKLIGRIVTQTRTWKIKERKVLENVTFVTNLLRDHVIF